MKSDKIVKPTTLHNPIYRTINNHSWMTALVVSIAVHGVFILGFFLVWPSASSKGQGQVMLLEAVHEHTKSQPNTQAQEASTQSVQNAHKSNTVQINGKKQQAKAQSSINKPEQRQQLETKASSSNKGALVDQSGKSPTPEDSYKQQLLKHLTNKMEGAPVNGNAIIHLMLIPQGIAININIEVKDGGTRYKQWVQRKVLSANPFPAMPKVLGSGNFTTSIHLFHEPDE